MMNILELRNESLLWLQDKGLGLTLASYIQSIFALILIVLSVYCIGKLSRWLLENLIPRLVSKSKTKLDDRLLSHNFFTVLSYYLIGIAFFWLDDLIAIENWRWLSNKMTGTYFTILTVFLLNTILNALYEYYKERSPREKGNLKVYLQLIKVVICSFAVIIIISFFADRNLIDILKGLGAMVTILLIVYKDTILGFVAGISLSANKMLEVGDWVSVPQCNADGTVLEIGLNTIKVQNWDKTITTIPPYKLISESFINWKGMEESGGRRIKRAVNIDIDTIHFLAEDEFNQLQDIELLQDYLSAKKGEKLTNVGTFKKYIELYLQSLKLMRSDMTFIVRQLQSTDRGLPIEIYCFSKVQAWADYEEIQADIFDHIFAMTKSFNLRVYQSISTSAVQGLGIK